MTDTDSYLLKCALELIEEGVPAGEIQEECKCRLERYTRLMTIT